MSGPPDIWVAPYRREFRLAHRPAEGAVTACGAPMNPEGCWLTVILRPAELRDGLEDRRCPRCLWTELDDAKRAAVLEHARAEADAENAQGHQEALL